MARLPFFGILVLFATVCAAAAAPVVVNSHPLHLGIKGSPEWDSFAGQSPDAWRLDLPFTAASNALEATIFIRQDDVRQDWQVELNGQRLGKLFLMEADLVQSLVVPPRVLRDGANVLSIVPPRALPLPADIDDIVINGIWIDPRPRDEALREATVTVRVTDAEQNRPLPCRLTIVDKNQSLAPLAAAPDNKIAAGASPQFIAVRPGVVYTGNGEATIGLPAGDYTLHASRGFEWSVAALPFHAVAGGHGLVSLQLTHEVPTPGLVSCDTHVHTFTNSGHGDATVEERLLTLAGEGIELAIATDHNFHTDYSEPARRLGVAGCFTPVIGNEVTTPAGHFNIFPVASGARIPDFQLTDWPALMREVRATPGVRVVILNHPRNIHGGFQPFAATNFNNVSGENKRGPDFSFDCMEVLNSSAQQSDYMLVYRDWFALLNHGFRVTGIGSSDSHDVSRYIVGQGRTYIACPDENPAAIDVATACSNLIGGHASVSMGLLTQMTVDEKFGVGDLATDLGDDVHVRVTVLGPSWVRAAHVDLFANGVKIRESDDPEGGNHPRAKGVRAVVEWTIPRPPHDVHLVAIATGPGITAPFWAIPRPYQPTSTHWEGRVVGSTNPIWLDADRDGHFTSARDYARQIVTAHPADAAGLVAALGAFDEPVATQAASLCAARNAPDAKQLEQALRSAPPHIRQAFDTFASSVR